MGIQDELKKMGYRFEYDHGDSEERTEVWINDAARMAVRIEWMRIDEEGWRAEKSRPPSDADQRDPPQRRA